MERLVLLTEVTGQKTKTAQRNNPETHCDEVMHAGVDRVKFR